MLTIDYENDEEDSDHDDDRESDESSFGPMIKEIVDRLQYTYQFRSLPCLPIFVQRKRNTPFEVFRNRYFIPREIERSTLELDFDEAEGCFACSDMQQKLHVSHDAPASKKRGGNIFLNIL